MRRDLKFELAPNRPGLLGGPRPEVDLAAHDHVHEPVAREIIVREPLVVDAEGVLRIGIIRIGGDPWNPFAGALEIAERRTAPSIDQRLDGSVGVLGRVMNLRDVVYRRDAVIELRESGEQFINVHVFLPVNGRELKEDVFVVRPAPAWRARAIAYENAVSKPATHRCLEQVVMRINKARHDDATADVDHRGAASTEVRRDGKSLVALDEHV